MPPPIQSRMTVVRRFLEVAARRGHFAEHRNIHPVLDPINRKNTSCAGKSWGLAPSYQLGQVSPQEVNSKPDAPSAPSSGIDLRVEPLRQRGLPLHCDLWAHSDLPA